ncbi:MAG: CDP-alcohol phosphatidyltransferase family protein [Candidatus Zixiibacteriota bacterium]
MARIISWANRVTIARIGIVFWLVLLVYDNNMWSRLLAAFLAILVIVGDWLDGFLARRLHEQSQLGSVLDIAGDRILETVLWIVLADLELVPVWIPIAVTSRAILTDSIRNYLLQYGFTAFGKTTMMQSSIGKFLTGSPIMRTGYALLKAFTFGWLLLISGLDRLWHELPFLTDRFVSTGYQIGYVSAIVTAVVCIARGIPPIVEGANLIRKMDVKPS